jgi:hypothetical protein
VRHGLVPLGAIRCYHESGDDQNPRGKSAMRGIRDEVSLRSSDSVIRRNGESVNRQMF